MRVSRERYVFAALVPYEAAKLYEGHDRLSGARIE